MSTPPGTNVRTRVHEYGGGAWWVDRGDKLEQGFDIAVRPPGSGALRIELTVVGADDRLIQISDWAWRAIEAG